MILNKAIEIFTNHCIYEKNLSEKTLKAYKSDFKQFALFIDIKQCESIQNINKEALKEYISELFKILKPKSIKRKIAVLKSFFNYLEFEDIIQLNPFRKMRIKIKLPLKLPVFLNLKELEQVLNGIYNLKSNITNKNSYHYKSIIRDIAIIECLFASGIRVSELCSLRKEDINLDTGELLIRGKGNKERLLYLYSEVGKQLIEYKNKFNIEIENSPYFFINRFKKRISEQSVRNIVKKYAQLAAIGKKVTPHTFRHSFATLLLSEGVNIRYIQEYLGHASITTTQIYSHVDCSLQKQILTQKHPRRLIKMN